MPGVPFLYYGDEIGMRYLDLPTKEGGYFRTGSRTPMQWTSGPNLGFSAADAKDLYLPVDPAPDAPTVEAQEKDPASLLNTVRALLSLRNTHEDLQADAPLRILCCEPGRPFIYRRGDMVLALNVNGTSLRAAVPGQPLKPVYSLGTGSWEDGEIEVGAQSFVVFA